MIASEPVSPGAEEAVGQPLIDIRGLNHSFGAEDLRQQVLFDINLSIARGEMAVLTGASGCGKTTLLTLIGALRSVQEGSLRVLNRELRGLGKGELREVRRNVGFIFQAHNLLEALPAWRNVKLAIDLQGYSAEVLLAHSKRLLGVLQGEAPRHVDLEALPRSRPALSRALAYGLLAALGLGHRTDHKPRELSGGQKQRVAVARAVVNHPPLVLADEPTAALDKQSGEIVINLLRKLAQHGSTVIIVTHDSRIMDKGDRIVHMKDGRIGSDIQVDETTKVCTFLQRVPLFAALSPSRLVEVGEKMTRERHPAGTQVIREGDAGDKFYLIREGRVEVLADEQGSPRLLATLGPGEFFGEAALLEDRPRNATVKAVGPVDLYALKKADFQEAISSSQSMREELIKVFAHRIRRH
jgi:putative ABC transport system ATP-binding protein